MEDIRVAAVVVNATVGAVSDNLARMRHWFQRAVEGGADIVCFPELGITGYSNRPEMTRYALGIGGEAIAELQSWARDADVAILAGLAETEDHQRFYATHLSLLPDGIIGIYRKPHLAPPEQGIYSPGNAVPLFTFRGVCFGVQLCYDAHFPELTTRMAMNGADVIFIPHASPRGEASEKHASWMRHLPARAFDNGVFIVACNQVGENGLGLSFPGNAVALDPSGNIIDTLLEGKEGMLMADLKSADLDHVRGHRMRYFLPNRRPDLYRID